MFSCTIRSCCQTIKRTQPEQHLDHIPCKFVGKKMWPKTSKSWMTEGPLLCTVQIPRLGAPYHNMLSYEAMRGLTTHRGVGSPMLLSLQVSSPTSQALSGQI